MKKYLTNLTLFIWGITGLFILSLIHSWHYVNLQDASTLKLTSVEDNKWGVYHFFDPHCSCSRAIMENLASRPPLHSPVVSEKIFYHESLGTYAETLQDKGYELIKTNFQQEGITGVPLLLIFDQNKNVQYLGGYSGQPVNSLFPPNEQKIISQVLTGKKIKNLPVIGCSVSKKYQKLLDPLGLKYASTNN